MQAPASKLQKQKYHVETKSYISNVPSKNNGAGDLLFLAQRLLEGGVSWSWLHRRSIARRSRSCGGAHPIFLHIILKRGSAN